MTANIVRLPWNRSRFAFTLALLLTWIFAVLPLTSRSTTCAQQTPTDFDSFAQSAAAARDSNHAAEAIQLYRRALDLRPDWAEGWWYLGTLLYDTDQFHDAIPAFQKVLSLAPQAPGTLNFLGLCEYETADYDSALQHLQHAYPPGSQEDPQLAHVAAYHLVLLLNRADNFKRAAAILSKDFSRGEASEQIVFAFGLTSLHVPLLPSEVDPSKEALIQSAGRLALSVAQKAALSADGYPALLKQYPNAPFLHAAHAAALESWGRPKEAAAERQLESKLHPPSSSSPSDVAALYGNASVRIRLGLAPSGRINGMESSRESVDETWQRATQLFASERYADSISPLKATIVAHRENGTAWAMLGLAEFETRDYDNALLHLQKGAALGMGGSADSVRTAKYRLGLLLIRSSRFDEAATLLVPEAEDNSLSPQIQFALGLALLHKPVFPEAVSSVDAPLVQSAGEISLLLHGSKYDAAFPKLQAIIQSHPNTPMLHYVYGLALASFSRYEEAETQFATESRINPQSELPYVQRAFVQLQVRHPVDALMSAQKAVELAPNSAEAHYVLGRSFLDSGKFEDAMKELQTAVEINPGSPEAHFNLAKAYAKLGRPEDAQRERDRFAELNAAIEKQRSEHGSQAYGAAHANSALSQGTNTPTQSIPPRP
jgi:tetratricopeptide (TPR) repeat protein